MATERSSWFSLRSLIQPAIEFDPLALEYVRLYSQSAALPPAAAITAMASAPASVELTSPFPEGDGLIASQTARECRARARTAMAFMAMPDSPTSLKPEMAALRRLIASSSTLYMFSEPTGGAASVLLEKAKSSWISPITMYMMPEYRLARARLYFIAVEGLFPTCSVRVSIAKSLIQRACPMEGNGPSMNSFSGSSMKPWSRDSQASREPIQRSSSEATR